MAILRTIDTVLENLESRRVGNRTCERCEEEGRGVPYRVYSDELRMNVCACCADQARRLGLVVKPVHGLGLLKYSRARVWLPRIFGSGKKPV